MKDPGLVHSLYRFIGHRPFLNLDLADNESTLKLFGPRARYQLFCSIVLAEFKKPEDLAQNHQKLMLVIKPLKTELLILSITGEVLWHDMNIFPSKTIVLSTGEHIDDSFASFF